MTVYEWDSIPKEQMSPTISRQVIHADRITIARVYLAKGAFVPRHSHENEQVTTLETGRMRFIFDDGERVIGPGQTLLIPSHVPHAAETIEDTVAVDLFAPIREDWIRGDDAYLRG